MMAALASAPVASFRSFDGLRTTSESTRVTPQQSVSCIPTRRTQITAEKKTAKRKQIILTVDVPELGKVGDLLAVKPGYFRNFLSPYLKAKSATPKILKSIQIQKEKLEAEKRKILEEAEAVARQFQTVGQFNVRRKQGQGKAIFGTVTSQDVSDIIRANTGKEVDKKDVEVPEVKEVGTYDVQIKLHPEVIATIKIVVVGTK